MSSKKAGVRVRATRPEPRMPDRDAAVVPLTAVEEDALDRMGALLFERLKAALQAELREAIADLLEQGGQADLVQATAIAATRTLQDMQARSWQGARTEIRLALSEQRQGAPRP